ncbi:MULTISPECIES: hypothetical protein [unclassified Agrobacterium]|uniref:hypothetical protein n=1 Tax=unclassified Agrobacterium TaxID=2632611 RepID=UPI0005573B78|nr:MULTISPECIES: hypothetical protein [unclassified Agrobacterium]QKW97063.1 hypothetical protein GSF67_08175 [Agrobacterium sp. CGMCC 11546]
MTNKYSGMTDDQLRAEELLLKWHVNSVWPSSIEAAKAQTERTYAEMKLIRDEKRRRASEANAPNV